MSSPLPSKVAGGSDDQDQSGSSLLQRPSLPLRAQSQSAAVSEASGRMAHPPSPAHSDSRVDEEAHTASTSLSASDDAPSSRRDASGSSGGSRRADMDRIKSRAVDTASWNWEAERAKLDAIGGDGAPSPSTSSSSWRQSIAAPIPPRQSSRQGGSSTPRPRIDTSPNPGLASAPDTPIQSSRPFSPALKTPTASAPQPAKAQGAQTAARRDQSCDACGKPMTGQFVRALGVVFHLDCFRCRDCNKVVASKFFPATDDMRDSSPRSSSGGDEEGGSSSSSKRPSPSSTQQSKLFPLCETDYFRRLDLLCAKCGGALRGSYITALGKKFHVEHFTCSICPTVFGPQDSYYEHDGRVFCHFHYSTRFAIRCTGCRTAILKQFVEINRNNQDEHWHPECYMIHKFWNIKLCPTGSTPKESLVSEPTTVPSAPQPSRSGIAPVSDMLATDAPSMEAIETEASETPSSLKQKQKIVEEQVYRIWTVLSAFEESSAACISEMLRHVSSGRYLGGVRMAERFILHVEILFSAIDDIEREFRKEHTKGLSHIREARMLCKKIVNFFSLLSHTQETGARRMGITQELLSLVTGLAHYLKILIRIALTGALRLDREFGNRQAIDWFLDQLAYLAEKAAVPASGEGKAGSSREGGNRDSLDLTPVGDISMQRPDGRWYGYKSLPRTTSINSSDGNEGATDLCLACGQTVEEECVRMGINMRWHATCLRCSQCKRRALRENAARKPSDPDVNAAEEPPAAPANTFGLEVSPRPPPAEGAEAPSSSRSKVYTTFCSDHAPVSCRRGFETGTRLEQYAFLLRVALNRLYALLKKRGVVPASPPPLTPGELAEAPLPSTSSTGDMDAAYREGADIKRMKSVNLDRKLSTKAKVPRISTVVGSPSGRQTQASSMQQRISPTAEGLRQSSSSSPRRSTDNDGQPRSLRRSPSPGAPRYRGHSKSRDPSPTGGQREPGNVVPIRPAFARHNTDVRIRDDGPAREASGDDSMMGAQGDDHLTLGDIPQLLEAEQAREQRRSLHHEGGRALSELSALELFIVKHMAVMMLQQSALKDLVAMDDLIEFIEMRKNTFWGKLFKTGKDKKKNVEKKGVFGIPLDILVEKNGADSTLGASTTHLRVPSFVDDIISAMKQMDVSVEGIFRKNGNIRRLKELSEALDRDSSSVNLADDNPVQLAALLKRFLRELPDPLLTFKLHRLFVMSQKLEPESERLRILHLVTILLPKAHRDTLEVLFVFLKWVASFSHVDEETGSKMDLQNLALVLGPNILYAKSQDPAKDELFLANRAILCLLENQDEFWMVPPELEAVLQDRELLSASAELTSRDILKRCEKYAKRARGQGSSGSTGRGGGGPMSGGGGPGEMHVGGSRQQRPEYHDPVTMRQIENQHYFVNGGGNGGMSRSGSAHPRSPIDGPSERPPWMANNGSQSHLHQHHHHHQHHPSSGGSGGAQTPYGSPDRSHQQAPQPSTSSSWQQGGGAAPPTSFSGFKTANGGGVGGVGGRGSPVPPPKDHIVHDDNVAQKQAMANWQQQQAQSSRQQQA